MPKYNVTRYDKMEGSVVIEATDPDDAKDKADQLEYNDFNWEPMPEIYFEVDPNPV